jgi:hypothetical protein
MLAFDVMKKFIKSLFLFTPFAMVMYLLLIVVWGNYAPYPLKRNLNFPNAAGYMCSRIKNIENVGGVDILLLGSSHAYSSFDPRIFKEHGLNIFSLGSSSQSHMQTELLLKRYLDEINPKLIIYEVYPEVFGFDGVESAIDIIVNDKNDFESIKMALRLNHIKVYNALIYGLYRDIFKGDVDCSEELSIVGQTYIEGGYVETENLYFEPVEFPERRWYITDEQVEYFEKVLLLIRQRNIPVIFIQTPITQSLYQSISNNKDFDDRMRKYGVYYNFNELMELDDELHFWDEDHLNQRGVEIFNENLIEILIEREGIHKITAIPKFQHHK